MGQTSSNDEKFVDSGGELTWAYNSVMNILFSTEDSGLCKYPYLLGRKIYNTAELVASTEINFCEEKQAVYNIACPKNCIHSGTLTVTRWSSFPLPREKPKVKTNFLNFQDVMNYEPSKSEDKNEVSWWVNFADSKLFVAHSSRLFAQDEMQVAEHPSLAHLAAQLKIDLNKQLERDNNDDKSEVDYVLPYTREKIPTPILIYGIERRCRVKTDVNPDEGRPNGLYGNNFAKAGIEAIETATEVINPPTITNLICMASLSFGRGSYTYDQIEDLFLTAYTSFRAARIESTRMLNNTLGDITPKVIVHTGNWGTGAFGGSKPLMAIIQVLAAISSGINLMVYHTFNEEGSKAYKDGINILNEELKKDISLYHILKNLEKRQFLWGLGDGN